MYTIMGATGNVGRKIADILIKRGEKVRLVASSTDQLRPLVGKNVQAFSGDALDFEFLAEAFKGADAVFTLIPSNYGAKNYLSYADRVGKSIARALNVAKIRYVVNLSSIGADLPGGTGPIIGLHKQEERLNRIEGLNVVHLRAGAFMENLLMNIDMIRSRGINGSAYRGDLKFSMISTKDVASVAADRLLKKDFTGSAIEPLLGQRDISMIECTAIIGKKINKPNLVYVMLPYDEAEKRLVDSGFSRDMSKLYMEMARAANDGRIYGSVTRTSENTTPTSFEEFCDEVLVPAYRQVKAA